MNNISVFTHKCTGCFACLPVCPVSAISEEKKRDGFMYPVVDENICISCGKCLKVCPINPEGEPRTYQIQKCYLVQTKDKEVLKRSSSGGAFYELAKNVLDNGGYVCGCVLNDQFKAEHICSNNYADIIRMQGSKYVQSHLSRQFYGQITEIAKEGKMVLFSGTPCQNAAIAKILPNFENVVLLDLICHGVGSPGVFEEHLLRLQKKINQKIEKVSFRGKQGRSYPHNFHLEIGFRDHDYDKDETRDPYYIAFSQSRILRESCYCCPYSSKVRLGDISIGDYLSKDNIPDDINNKEGIGLLTVNSEKGTKALKTILGNMNIVNLDQIPYKRNLNHPEPRPKERDLLNQEGCTSNQVLRRKKADIIKTVIPSGVRRKIKRIVHKCGAGK